jgi:uncharacterized surface protein with fasciclin (FAS1) repeats
MTKARRPDSGAASRNIENASSGLKRASAPDEVVFAVAVWGDWHVNTFVTLCIPSLLSSGNLPAFVGMRNARCIVFTTERDRSIIQASASWRQFAALIDVSFSTLSTEEISDPIDTQQKVWSQAIGSVAKTGSFLFFMPPDVAWSDGSMQTIANALAHGKNIIVVPWTVRAVSETFLPAAVEYLRQGGIAGGFPARKLVRMTLQHLHPLMSAYRRDSNFFPYHAEMLLLPIAQQGILLNLLASTPTIFRPSDITLNQNKLIASGCQIEDVYMPMDSDDLFAVSLTPLVKEFHFFNRPRRSNPIMIGRWWTRYPSASNDILANISYRIHYSPIDVLAWRKAERMAQHFLQRCMVTRDALTLWDLIFLQRDLVQAGRLLALAVNGGLLTRIVGRPGRKFIAIPNDSAFAAARIDMEDLCSYEQRHRLVRTLRQHVMDLPEMASEIDNEEYSREALNVAGERVAISSREGALYVAGRRVIGRPISFGSHVMVVTDGIIGIP